MGPLRERRFSSSALSLGANASDVSPPKWHPACLRTVGINPLQFDVKPTLVHKLQATLPESPRNWVSAGAVKNLKWELSRHDICEDDLLPDAVETSSVIALAAFGCVSRDSGRCLVEGSSHGADGRRNRILSVAA